MDLKVTLTVEIKRTDGSITMLTEVDEERCGDNPKFEGRDAARLIDVAKETLVDRLPIDPGTH